MKNLTSKLIRQSHAIVFVFIVLVTVIQELR
jgi:hypothetical protein